jgi:hypothetical protein
MDWKADQGTLLDCRTNYHIQHTSFLSADEGGDRMWADSTSLA